MKGEYQLVEPNSEDPIWIPEHAHINWDLLDRFDRFCWDNLIWPSGMRTGERVQFDQWQRDKIIIPMLGLWWNDLTKGRVTREVYFESARGTGKTTLPAIIALFQLSGAWGVERPKIEFYARNQRQAKHLYDRAVSLYERSPTLANTSMRTLTGHRLVNRPLGGEITVRTGDAEAELGSEVSLICFDELLSQRNGELFAAAKTSLGKRPDDLIITMTTPGFRAEAFAKREHDKAILINKQRTMDPSYLPVIFAADKKDDPYDQKTWHKACPSLKSGFMDESAYQREALDAQLDPAALHRFKIFRLAIWPEQTSGEGMFLMDAWDSCAQQPPNRQQLQTMKCWIGVDMSARSDLTSVCLLFYESDHSSSTAWALWRHWVTPAKNAHLNRWTDQMWQSWVDAPSTEVRITGENWIPDREVADRIIQDCVDYDVQEIGIDYFRSREMMKLLKEEANLPVFTLSSAGRALSAAIDTTSSMVASKRLKHNGDPIARWCASLTEIRYTIDGWSKMKRPQAEGVNPSDRTQIDATACLVHAVDRRLAFERGDKLPVKPKAVFMTKDMEMM